MNEQDNGRKNQFPLYPRLMDGGADEAQKLFDGFREQMTKISKEVLSNLYTDVAAYIESDSWTNFRNNLLDGICDYRNSKIQAIYDFKKIREKIYREYRDDIIKDISDDIVAENEKLKAENNDLKKQIHDHYNR